MCIRDRGSSADIMKLAMIAIYNDPQYKALDCHMVITVHDELIMEVPEDHIKDVYKRQCQNIRHRL